ncbi:MAG TPA: VOC family protein, partial [Micromonosporaceae bacterium]|nr:VOC family protein [Micromonosporaceae bacterium]
RQRGIRHFGMKVADVDAWVARLRAAGVAFDLGPFDAVGGVRIAFFRDPDGTCLELVQGYVRHHNLWSEQLAQQEIDGDRDWDGRPRFDHVAITVPDLDQALTFYAGRLGLGRIGQVVRPADENGFLITNLRAAPATLEVFSFDVATHARDDAGEPDALGLRAIGITGAGADRTGPGDVALRRVD